MCFPKEAVQTAKTYIQYFYLDYIRVDADGNKKRYCHPAFWEYSDVKRAKADEAFHLYFLDTETHLRLNGRRIKLYEHDCVDNKKLIELAMTDFYLFDDLKKQIAFELEHDYKLAPSVQKFVAGILSDNIQPPKKITREKEGEMKKYVLLIAADQVRLQHNLNLTRNEASSTISALDVVSEATNQLDMKKMSYATISVSIERRDT